MTKKASLGCLSRREFLTRVGKAGGVAAVYEGCYDPFEYEWQSTLFQPVGGMDKIVEGFLSKVGWQEGAMMSAY